MHWPLALQAGAARTQPIGCRGRHAAMKESDASGGRRQPASRGAAAVLRLIGGPRLGLALLLLAAGANTAAAIVPQWRSLLDSPPYLALIGAMVLSGMASVAIRGPAAWREWRRPSPLAGGSQMLVTDIPVQAGQPVDPAHLQSVLRGCGYRVQRHNARGGWRLAAVRHGWSRFAGIGSHLSVVVLVVGAAIGTAFAEETRFGLFPGEQSFLAAPRPDLTSAVRFDRLDARFDDRGRPVRFDTHVTLLRDAEEVRSQVLRVNEPADFDGHLVHAWTYGPAVALRVEDLGGGALFDGWVALGGDASGGRAPFIELPQLDMVIGLDIADAATNTLAAVAADGSGRTIATAVINPGERTRLGPTTVVLDRFASYVTFMSRRDPGLLVLFAGATLLSASLAAAFYWPRRRIDLAPAPGGGLRLRIRGERFDDPRREVERLHRRLTQSVAR